MEITWKCVNLCIGIFVFSGLSECFPISLEESSDQHSQLLTGLVAILLTVCSIVLVAGCLCCQRNRNGFKEFRDSPVVASTASNLDHGIVNPITDGEFTIFTPLSPPSHNNNVFLANDKIVSRTSEDYASGDFDVSSWFSEHEKDFPRYKLKYIKEIGKGWFGKVVEGAAQEISSNQIWSPVIVRILDATASSKDRVLFLHEASIYRCKPHPNILGLIGRCLDSVPFLILQEYCPKGDLKAYLRANANNPEKLLNTEYPLVWCCQITSALKYLHQNNMVLSDLATRNCQLTQNLTLKLGDYGLAISKYPEDYYQGTLRIPVRWCSPESLNCTSTTIQPKKITSEANVWSLGVTIWEICECGVQPYYGLTDDEVVTQVFGSQNLRLNIPRCSMLYTDYLYRLMQMCWTNAESRPAVSQIELMLLDLLQVLKHTKNTPDESSLSVDDFDKRWISLKPNDIVKTDNLSNQNSDQQQLSSSLNNLHGSLDVESSLQKNTENSRVANELDTDDQHHVTFQLGLNQNTIQKDSLTDSGSLQRTTSSESETEDDNWRRKVERGAYTEKVRQKSRSVTDLMVLTTIDYSESESETPLHSLEFRKSIRNPRNNLETVSLAFSSEGNLLNLEDKFQEQLKQLQVERRDSLPYVPDIDSQNSVGNDLTNPFNQDVVENLPTQKLMLELNSPMRLKPADQIYNVFNVTIDKYSPVHNFKLNASDTEDILEIKTCEELERRIEDNPAIEQTPEKNIQEKLEQNETTVHENQPNNSISSEADVVIFQSDANKTDDEKLISLSTKNSATVPKLSDIIQNNDELMDFIINKYGSDEDSVLIQSQFDSTKEVPNVEDDETKLMFKACDESKFDSATEEPPLEQESVSEVGTLNQNLTKPPIPEDETKPVDNSKEKTDTVPDKETGQESMVNSEPECILTIPEKENQTVIFVTTSETTQPIVEFDLSQNQDGTIPHSLTQPIVEFDLSQNQDGAMPNSLTHSTLFTSTPFGRKKEVSLRSEDTYSSLNLFSVPPSNEEDLAFSSNFAPLDKSAEKEDLNYSLETWDNFLVRSFDNQQDEENLFDSFSSEPKSMVCIENQADMSIEVVENNKAEENVNNGTYVVEEKEDATFIIEGKDEDGGTWESGGGWFLHPQSNSDQLTGSIDTTHRNSDSYVGFDMDDEIMAAIRNELLQKLPHAQGASSSKVREEEEWETGEKNEVFLKYNVYNTPLSPIPEESMVEESSGETTPK